MIAYSAGVVIACAQAAQGVRRICDQPLAITLLTLSLTACFGGPQALREEPAGVHSFEFAGAPAEVARRIAASVNGPLALRSQCSTFTAMPETLLRDAQKVSRRGFTGEDGYRCLYRRRHH